MRVRRKKEKDFYQRIVDEFPPATVDIESDPDQSKPCVSCIHNVRIRVNGNITNVQCRCDIDWHYIGYCACFEQTCPHYARKKTVWLKRGNVIAMSKSPPYMVFGVDSGDKGVVFCPSKRTSGWECHLLQLNGNHAIGAEFDLQDVTSEYFTIYFTKLASLKEFESAVHNTVEMWESQDKEDELASDS